MLASAIIENIRDEWMTIGTLRNDQEMLSSQPESDDLRALLETTFLTSIKQEERRPLRFRLIFSGQAASPPKWVRQWPWVESIPFRDPLLLTTETIRKLACAFDQDAAGLVVVRDGSAYLIVGACFYRRGLSLANDTALGRPTALSLSTRTSGTVIIGFGDAVVGRFIDGKFVVAKANWTGSRLLVEHIIRHIRTHSEFSSHGMEYWYLYRAFLEQLYSNVAKLDHGGTIVWVPSQSLQECLQSVRHGHRVSLAYPGSYLAGLVLGRRRNPEDGKITSEYRNRLNDYCNMLSQLSTVDGALIIDDRLAPHHFAGHLEANWNGKVFEGPLREEQATVAFEYLALGTRHQSAIRFAGSNPGTVVFVVSEDGGVRVVSRLADPVLVWPNCLDTVFLDR